MAEPYLPVPPPEPDSNLSDPVAVCPQCGVILINPHPRPNGVLQGTCDRHGLVPAVYRGRG